MVKGEKTFSKYGVPNEETQIKKIKSSEEEGSSKIKRGDCRHRGRRTAKFPNYAKINGIP